MKRAAAETVKPPARSISAVRFSRPESRFYCEAALYMYADAFAVPDQPVILGFDPGRWKCGIAVMGVDRSLRYHQVVDSHQAAATVQQLCSAYPVSLVVIGDQTSSKEWKARLAVEMPEALRVVAVDERNSTLEARDRYWQMYPPTGLKRLVPQALRAIPRPIDDIVAILLIERYLERLATHPRES